MKPWIIVLALLILQSVVFAQPKTLKEKTSISKEPRINLTLEHASIPKAIESLFAAAHKTYSIDSSVDAQKLINVKLKNALFGDALKELARVSNLSWSKTGKVYQITGNDQVTQNDQPRITVDMKQVALPKALSYLFEGTQRRYILYPNVDPETYVSIKLKNVPLDAAIDQLAKITNLEWRKEGSIYLVSRHFTTEDISPKASSTDQPTISVDAEKLPISQLIDILFTRTGQQYVIDPSVNIETRVDLHLKDVPLEAAIDELAKIVDLVWRKDGNIYLINKRKQTKSANS